MVRSPAAAWRGAARQPGLAFCAFVVTLVVPGSVIGTGAPPPCVAAPPPGREARSELIRQIDAARSTHDGRAARVAALTAEMSARDASDPLAAESGEDASRPGSSPW